MMNRLTVRFAPAIIISMLLVVPLWTGCGSKENADRSTVNHKLIPAEARTLLVKANDAMRSGAYHLALAYTDSAEAVKADLIDASFIRGRVYTELQQLDKAEQAYEKMLELDPNYQGIRQNLGNNAFRQGSFRKAIRLYQKEQELYPSATLWLHIARAYDQLEKPDSAVYAYQKAIDFDASGPSNRPVRADAHIRLAQLLEDQGKLDEGLTHAQQSVELMPKKLTYRYVAGSLLYRMGHAKKALKELRRVVEADPSHQSAHYKLGQVLIRLRREEEAQPYLDRADSLQQVEEELSQLQTLAEQNPNNPKRWIKLGEALRRADRLTQAIEAYRVVLTMNPSNLPIQMTIANLVLQTGDATEAIQRYQAMLRQHPSFADAWINMGVAYASMGKEAEARAAWNRVLETEPENEIAKEYLQEISN